MTELKKDFCIILWSTEDITIDNIELKTSIECDAPNAEIQIVNLKKIKQMRLKSLRSLLDNYSDKSALIVCSSEEELENLDFWKLGFVMGKMSIPSKDGKTRIIGYLKGSKNSFFKELSELFLTCDTEIEIKREMKGLLKDIGIETKFDISEFTLAANIASKKGLV